MRKNGRHSRLHTYLFILFCLALALLASAATFMRTRASSPSLGSISATQVGLTIWNGDSLATGGTGGESNCIDDGPAKNCDQFTLTVNGNPSDWVGKLVQVRAAWNLQTDDYDLYVHKGTLSGPLAGSGANGGQPGTEEVAFLIRQHGTAFSGARGLCDQRSRTGYLLRQREGRSRPGAGHASRHGCAAIPKSLSADQSDYLGQRPRRRRTVNRRELENGQVDVHLLPHHFSRDL